MVQVERLPSRFPIIDSGRRNRQVYSCTLNSTLDITEQLGNRSNFISILLNDMLLFVCKIIPSNRKFIGYI